MKKFTSIIPLIFFISFSLYAQKVIYISPTGNDKGDGSKQLPYNSILKALEGNINTQSTDTLFVHVEPGNYYLDRPILLNEASTRPIVIKSSSEKEKPKVIGGIKIENWEKYGDKLYRAYIPEVLLYDFGFEQFFVNGKRATLARTPNTGWNFVEGVNEHIIVEGISESSTPYYAIQQILLKPDDIKSLKKVSKKEVDDLKFKFYHKWDVTQKYIDHVNVDSGYVYIRGEEMKPWNPIEKKSRYVMYNYFAALDTPGEWFLDKKEGYVYYMPYEGENINESICIAPTLEKLVIFKGQPDSPIKNITFDNISFQYSSYQLPPIGEDPSQASALNSATIELDFAENISLIDCEILHTGAYGIWIGEECHNNTIERCYIADLGAGGIKIGVPQLYDNNKQVSHDNVINNNIITNGGKELPCGVGVALFHTSDNKVTHNEISNLRYSGVSVGWVWGYTYSPSARNIIEYNHIHHIGWGELSDMGAVYTLGESPGTRVSHNVVHDILSYDYGGWGLYTDEGSTDVEMTHNLVYRCKSGGFHQHYGKNNKIENNIFAFGYYYQAQYTRVEPHKSFSFKHNIILQDKGETIQGPWDKGNMDIDYNLYWNLSGDLSFPNHSVKDWMKKKEPHSVIANPMFKDAANDNFEFKNTKNIKKIKFEVFDYSKAGVYGSEDWKKKAQLCPEIIKAFDERTAIILK